MTRFTSYIFKVTPINLEAKEKDQLTLSFICQILNTEKYESSSTPTKGWIRFLENDADDLLINDNITTTEFPDGIPFIIATSIEDKLDTTIKKKLDANRYQSLSEAEKYYQIMNDYIFFKKENKLYCLFSSTTESAKRSAKTNFFSDKPFSNYSYFFEFNPSEFQINSDIIYWLLFKFLKRDGIINESLTILDISIISGGMESLPIKLKYSGNSTPQNLIELIMSIAEGRTFNSIKFIIDMEKEIFEFLIHSDGSTEFKPTECYLDNNSCSIEFLKRLSTPIKIYSQAIPKIKKAYKDDKQWNSNKQDFIIECNNQCIKNLESLKQ